LTSCEFKFFQGADLDLFHLVKHPLPEIVQQVSVLIHFLDRIGITIQGEIDIAQGEFRFVVFPLLRISG